MHPADVESLTRLLASAGFIAAHEEAAALIAACGGDAPLLDAMVTRRLTGEPLAWITGRIEFCGVNVRVDPGVYVPRWHTEHVADRAVERLPATGLAVDLCTGSGAVAAVLGDRRPAARVVATEQDRRSVDCARANGVEVYHGDLFAPLPDHLRGCVDVVVAVVPYVPTAELDLLQRDTFAFELTLAYDGGADGTDALRRVISGGPRFLRRGGALVLELGGDQVDRLREHLRVSGYSDVRRIVDEDGDLRGMEATFDPASAADIPAGRHLDA